MAKQSRKITTVVKRDGHQVTFALERIVLAIFQALLASGEGDKNIAKALADEVLLVLNKTVVKNHIDVESIQDIVEQVLINHNYVKTAKVFILYRQQRLQIREEKQELHHHVKQLSEQSKAYFHNTLSEFVYLRTYARWLEDEKRRETWVETVERYMTFMKQHLQDKLKNKEYESIKNAILTQQVMPSMRLLQFAGVAAERTNVCTYNCAYIAPQCWRDFAEIMYISMCGTGVGFSVEHNNINCLPTIKPQQAEKLATHVIADSKEGWCDALHIGLQAWSLGQDIEFDYSLLRPTGARLKTMGGKSSGPAPLQDLLKFARIKLLNARGRRLTCLEAHDLICKIGEVVVAGGVRRSAMISLSDLDDLNLRHAKQGQFYFNEPQRSLANNSAVYHQQPTPSVFLEEWLALMKSGSGERGLFNRGGLVKTLPKRRLDYFRRQGLLDDDNNIGLIGTNPCAEIILQSKQFCNLSEVIARSDDNEKSLLEKIKIATILGTYQASLTHFPYLSTSWRENCEAEALLGVSITGLWDCPSAREVSVLKKLKQQALRTNRQYAKRFGINQATCVTCIKPSGTVSQVVDCASGMHPRHAPYYLRRIRISATDALFNLLRDQGIPYHPEACQTGGQTNTYVLEFPVAAPKNSIYRDDLSALEQLNFWRDVKLYYTEHNPSVTISVAEDEWLKVAHWLMENWTIIGGLSFLPRDQHVYPLAPYEAISKKHYQQLIKQLKAIDFSKLIYYENEDGTEFKQQSACSGNLCEF